MKVHTKIWLETNDGKLLLGEGRLEIFQAIERTGSLSAAAREFSMSYRAIWGKVKATEERLGIKLVHGTTGGSKHGGTQLTDEGREFVARFSEFNKRARKAVDDIAQELISELLEENPKKS